jgi:hypothetical protein
MMSHEIWALNFGITLEVGLHRIGSGYGILLCKSIDPGTISSGASSVPTSASNSPHRASALVVPRLDLPFDYLSYRKISEEPPHLTSCAMNWCKAFHRVFIIIHPNERRRIHTPHRSMASARSGFSQISHPHGIESATATHRTALIGRTSLNSEV